MPSSKSSILPEHRKNEQEAHHQSEAMKGFTKLLQLRFMKLCVAKQSAQKENTSGD